MSAQQLVHSGTPSKGMNWIFRAAAEWFFY